MIRAWFDGAVEPINPGGHGGFGVVVKRNDEVIYTEASYMGRWATLSNNCAEYAGAIAVLRFLIREGIQDASIFGDADMIVQQLNGRWRVKNGAYIPYFQEAQALHLKVPGATFSWLPREQNAEADELSKVAVVKRPRVVEFKLDTSIELQPLPKFKTRHRSRREPRFTESTDDEVTELFKLRYGDL